MRQQGKPPHVRLATRRTKELERRAVGSYWQREERQSDAARQPEKEAHIETSIKRELDRHAHTLHTQKEETNSQGNPK